MEISEESFELVGYRAVVLREWIFRPQKINCAFLVYTGQTCDSVFVSVANPAQNLIFNADNFKNLWQKYFDETSAVSALLCDTTAVPYCNYLFYWFGLCHSTCNELCSDVGVRQFTTTQEITIADAMPPQRGFSPVITAMDQIPQNLGQFLLFPP
jgi:hypothetical protein